ncbi:MAG: hypothetical protein C0404_07440 [Verrucomicrobia bacterium]|nr:hypothetical protein [Verrucomicrobiota bacterium]
MKWRWSLFLTARKDRSSTGMCAETRKRYSGKPLVVVEFGSDWIKVAQVENSRGKGSISRLAVESTESLGSDLAKSLADVFKKHKFARSPVVICLPRQMINVRMLELPSTEPNEIADMVDLQIGKQTPYSKDEIVSDYRVTGSAKEGYTNVVLAIAQRIIARQRCQLLEEAGLEVSSVSASTEGLLNWYAAAGGDGGGCDALVDIDSFYSDFMVMSAGIPVFSRSILVGANNLREDFARWKEKLAREIQRSIESCQAESQGGVPRRILLTGAAHSAKEFAVYLQGFLGMTVECRDALASLSKPLPAAGGAGDGRADVSLTSIAGVALQPDGLEFNLMPDSVGVRKDLERRALGLTWFGALIMCTLLAFSVYATITFTMKKTHLNELENKLAETEPVKNRVARMKETLRLVDSREKPAFSAIAIMSDIHSRTPTNVLFDSIDMDVEKGQVVLGGLAGTRADVSVLVKNLLQSELFKEAKEQGASVLEKKTGKFAFKVICSREKKQ